MTAALSVRELEVRYGGVRAVDGVSFTLGPGEIRGLIGPNGSGKSTCIDAISGRKPPAGGQVALFGADITRLSAAARRRRGLSRSFQRTSIFPLLTVAQHVRLVVARFGTDGAATVLELLGLAGKQAVQAASLAYGEQRRLDLALALLGNPRVLLLDEPAAGLSREESLVLAELLRELVRRLGIAVLLVEHDMEVIFGVSDRVTVFDAGRIVADGDPPAVRRDAHVRRAYLGSEA